MNPTPNRPTGEPDPSLEPSSQPNVELHPTVRLPQPTGVFLNDTGVHSNPPQPHATQPLGIAPAQANPGRSGLPPLLLGGVLLLGIAVGGAGVALSRRSGSTPAIGVSTATVPNATAVGTASNVLAEGQAGSNGGDGEETGAMAGNVVEEGEGSDKDVGRGDWAHGKARLMIPGEFSVFDTKDLPADGEEWLGLFRSGDKEFALKATKVRVEVVPQPGLGAATEADLQKDRNGRKVTSQGQGEGATVPLLLRGMRNLPVGPVKTAWARPNMSGWVHAEDNETPAAKGKESESADAQAWLDAGQKMEWSLGEQSATLRWDSPAPKGKEEQDGEMVPGTRLKLRVDGGEDEGEQTLLLSGKNIRIMGARPMWAGDLDGDSRLDLILECQEHRGDQAVEVYQAWLSSSAEPGGQVGKAAEFVEEICCV